MIKFQKLFRVQQGSFIMINAGWVLGTLGQSPQMGILVSCQIFLSFAGCYQWEELLHRRAQFTKLKKAIALAAQGTLVR